MVNAKDPAEDGRGLIVLYAIMRVLLRLWQGMRTTTLCIKLVKALGAILLVPYTKMKCFSQCSFLSIEVHSSQVDMYLKYVSRLPTARYLAHASRFAFNPRPSPAQLQSHTTSTHSRDIPSPTTARPSHTRSASPSSGHSTAQ
jgi:hypothetical protein